MWSSQFLMFTGVLNCGGGESVWHEIGSEMQWSDIQIGIDFVIYLKSLCSSFKVNPAEFIFYFLLYFIFICETWYDFYNPFIGAWMSPSHFQALTKVLYFEIGASHLRISTYSCSCAGCFDEVSYEGRMCWILKLHLNSSTF